MATTIPMADQRREYTRIRSAVDSAVGRVLQRGLFVLGEEGEAFEAEWASFCGVAHAVGVGSGTDAVHLALRAAGVGPGDEVILPALGSPFTALAVSMAGAEPVFADIDPQRHTLDPAAFEAAISPRTVAVVAVLLHGSPADMTPIVDVARRHHLLVVEDASHAHGARHQGRRTGSLGDAAAFSFSPGCNLGAYGDAGAVTTADAALAEKVRLLRDGGRRAAQRFEIRGISSRLDEIQAAILRVKLPHLDAWNRRRRTLAERYSAGLGHSEDLVLPATPAETEPIYHRFVVRTQLRDGLHDYMTGAGVETGIHCVTIPFQEVFAYQGHKPGAYSHAEQVAAQVISLPIFPQLLAQEIDQVVRLIRIFYAVR